MYSNKHTSCKRMVSMTEEQRNQVSLSILVKMSCKSLQVQNCFSLSQPPYHPNMETSRQPIASTTQTAYATPMENVHPGLPSIMAPQSQSKGWRSSTDRIAVETERKTLMSASQTSSQPLPAKCFLEVLSLASLLDLAQMDNT